MGSRAHPFNVRRSIGDLRRTVFSLFHEYIVGGYISLSLESLSRGMHQSLSIFFFSRVTSPFLPVLQPRCAIRGLSGDFGRKKCWYPCFRHFMICLAPFRVAQTFYKTGEKI